MSLFSRRSLVYSAFLLGLLWAVAAVPVVGGGYLALPEMMRLCRATGERALAARLLQGTDSPVPSHQNAAASARAEFAEIEGDLEEASRLHAEAADRWGGFGFVYERAHSLLGAGRALTLLGRRDEAEAPLRQARAIFSDLGAQALFGEADALLGEATAGDTTAAHS